MMTLFNNTAEANHDAGRFQSSGYRQKIDQLMDILYSGGVNNPIDSIEQITYLLFIRLLSEKDDLLATLSPNYKGIFSGDWSKYAWGNFVTLTGDNLYHCVRDAIEKLHELPGLSATGKLLFRQATLKIYDRPTLRAVVQEIHGLNLENGQDLKGDTYEYVLAQIRSSGTNGQFRTPRHIIDLIVRLVDPKPNQRVCDPAVGTAGFLIAAYKHIVRQNSSESSLALGKPDGKKLKPAQWKFLETQAFTGYDNDANMVKISIMNLYLHGLEAANIDFHNPLTTNKGGSYPGALFDVILANPPFSGSIQKESILSDINLATRNTELLFIKWFIDHLAPNGRAGVIVPCGVLSGSNKASKKVRELLLNKCDLQAVISLPSGVFLPYSPVGTAILIFEKGGPTESVWFYDVDYVGFTLTDTQIPTPDRNDLPDIEEKFPRRVEGPKSIRIPAETILQTDVSLVSGRYRTVQYNLKAPDPPAKVLESIRAIELQILKTIESFQKRLER